MDGKQITMTTKEQQAIKSGLNQSIREALENNDMFRFYQLRDTKKLI